MTMAVSLYHKRRGQRRQSIVGNLILRTSRIRRIAAILLSLVSLALVLGALGCGSDTTPPTTPANLARTTGDSDNTPTFVWSAAEDKSGIARYFVGIDSGSLADVGDVTTYTRASALSDGSHTFEVRAVDKARNVGTAAKISFICDTTSPAVSEISVSDTSALTATISWATNEPSTSQVEYGTTAVYGLSSLLDTNLLTGHSVSLSGLTSSTTHHFRVRSKDAAGNEAVSVDHTFATAATASGQLKVHFIDVGQGDAILIDDGTYEVLIDGGDSNSGIVGYLGTYVDGPLEAMVATHPDADHIGGLTAVLDAFEVQQIWLNGDSSASETYVDFLNAVQDEGAAVHIAHRGDAIAVGGLTFNVLNPVDLTGTTNNNSIVLSLTCGQVDFLFTGDAEQEAEASMVAAGIVPDVEVLKVGHHGSRTASSTSFLAAAKPEVAVYMAGADNTYGYPHDETIAALQGIGASTYGTDIHQTIIVTTDGTTYGVQPDCPPPPLFFFQFHDTLKDQYDNVRPLLQEFGWKANFAITPSLVGLDPAHMDMNQVQELVLEGHEIAMHGWTHEYPALTPQALAQDASSAATTLQMASAVGFGVPTTTCTLKARIYDDISPTGEYVEIVANNESAKTLTLRAGLVGSYAVSNNARVTLDDPACLQWMYQKAYEWFRDNLNLQDIGMIGTGGAESHLPQEAHYREKYFSYITWGSLEHAELGSLYNHSTSSGVFFIPTAAYDTSSDLSTIEGRILESAHPGYFGGLYFHHITQSPNDPDADSTERLRDLFTFVKDAGFRVVTMCTLVEHAGESGAVFPWMPLYKDSLPARSTTSPDDCSALDISSKPVALTVGATYHASATQGGKLYLYTSPDGVNWDAEPVETKTLAFTAGSTKQETFTPGDAVQRARFLKCRVENLDQSQAMTNIRVVVTLGG